MEGSVAVKLFSKNKIELHKEIGSGSFGKVLKGEILINSVTWEDIKIDNEFQVHLKNPGYKLRLKCFTKSLLVSYQMWIPS